jgi:GNAT superfamily N-acetyltransferase
MHKTFSLKHLVEPGPTHADRGCREAARLPQEPLVAQLGPSHRPQIAEHLIALPPGDRRLRFGYAISDDLLSSYVRGLRFSRDAAFGAFDEAGQMRAFGHLAFVTSDETAEFGISVAPDARRLGIGRALLDRAGRHARNRGYRLLVMAFVPENAALAALARAAGMQLIQDQVEPRAYLALDVPDAESVLGEAWSEAIAAIDLGFRRAAGARPTSA